MASRGRPFLAYPGLHSLRFLPRENGSQRPLGGRGGPGGSQG